MLKHTTYLRDRHQKLTAVDIEKKIETYLHNYCLKEIRSQFNQYQQNRAEYFRIIITLDLSSL